MSDTVIRVENLSKRYRLGAVQARYGSLRESLVEAAALPFRKLRSLASGVPLPAPNEIWALKDISFEVQRGEVLGIIGRNGAGKSTLLKILSRITRPTEGRVRLRGRVGSLLEVGTGFHPELTGRENIYLNGAILGMRRSEIERKFDEIVAFAEIEQFLDTPVKHYSSGMYMRLAFAVAAHLEPEILLVDEVLAVGDAQFQKKCLGKMGEVAKEGRTVLFVSHNMNAIEVLCELTCWINKGIIRNIGQTKDIVSDYMSQSLDNKEILLSDCPRRGSGRLRLVDFHLEDTAGNRLEKAESGQEIIFALKFINYNCGPTDRVSCSFGVHNDKEYGLFHYYSHFSDVYFKNLPYFGYFKCRIPDLPLSPGNYLLSCRATINGDHSFGEEADWPQVYIPFAVSGGDFFRTGDANVSTWGPILVKGYWFMTDE